MILLKQNLMLNEKCVKIHIFQTFHMLEVENLSPFLKTFSQKHFRIKAMMLEGKDAEE